MTGISSYQANSLLQAGQRDLSLAKGSSFGTRKPTTLKKEPNIKPKIKRKTMNKTSMCTAPSVYTLSIVSIFSDSEYFRARKIPTQHVSGFSYLRFSSHILVSYVKIRFSISSKSHWPPLDFSSTPYPPAFLYTLATTYFSFSHGSVISPIFNFS